MKRQLCRLSICILALVLYATPAFADWSATFDADAVNSYQTSADARLVVVAAGDVARSRPAAASFAAALRAGSAKLVMDDQALGDVAGLDDAAIVQKAANLPVDHVAIVRVFEAAADAAAPVVVIVYDKAGESQWAVSGAQGQALARNAEAAGVPVKTSRSVANAAIVGRTISQEARERFEEEFVWFADYVGVSASTGAVMASWSTPYQGKYRKPLANDAFYEAVGRPDLADEYRSNYSQSRWGTNLTVVGLLGVIGFGTWAMTSWLVNTASEASTMNTTTPLILTGVSVVPLVAGMIISPSRVHPVDPSGARRLADEHNKRLREELGLPQNYMPMSNAAPAAPSRFDFDIDLVVNGDGGGLVLRLDF